MKSVTCSEVKGSGISSAVGMTVLPHKGMKTVLEHSGDPHPARRRRRQIQCQSPPTTKQLPIDTRQARSVLIAAIDTTHRATDTIDHAESPCEYSPFNQILTMFEHPGWL